jgi:hypothetical protein
MPRKPIRRDACSIRRAGREPYVRGSERFEIKGSRGAIEDTKTARGTAPLLAILRIVAGWPIAFF